MEQIEAQFSDNEGNHLMVALDFYDKDCMQTTFCIPPEFSDIDIVDISITKLFLDQPIKPVAFFKMSSWLLEQFEKLNGVVFTYICSTDELFTNHKGVEPQFYRWRLFDRLMERKASSMSRIGIQDVIIGPEGLGFQTYGRAFYKQEQAPIIHIVVSYLRDKQRLSQ